MPGPSHAQLRRSTRAQVLQPPTGPSGPNRTLGTGLTLEGPRGACLILLLVPRPAVVGCGGRQAGFSLARHLGEARKLAVELGRPSDRRGGLGRSLTR